MNKLQSLCNLKAWDFNVPHFIEFDGYWTVERLVEEFGRVQLAVRSCKKEASLTNFACPFIYDISAEEAVVFAKKVRAQDFQVIVYEYVPKEWSLISGHIQFDIDMSGFYEIYRGTGVVRDIMSKSMEELERCSFQFYDYIKDAEMRDIVQEAKDIELFEQRPLIVEFSWGCEGAGTKAERLIFWEYRYV